MAETSKYKILCDSNFFVRSSFLESEITHLFPEYHSRFNIFSAVINHNELAKIIVEQSNVHAPQNGKEFQTNDEEMKSSLEINYLLTVNKLLTIVGY